MTAYDNVNQSRDMLRTYLRDLDFTNSFTFEGISLSDYGLLEKYISLQNTELDLYYNHFINGDSGCYEYDVFCPQGINSFITIEYPSSNFTKTELLQSLVSLQTKKEEYYAKVEGL